jgi:AbrB family looped-hinge helix DNA binding protein
VAKKKTMKVGPKGQVVIPKEVRDELGMKPGEEVVVHAAEGAAVVRRLSPPSELVGLLSDGATTADLEAARRYDRDLEERKAERWS